MFSTCSRTWIATAAFWEEGQARDSNYNISVKCSIQSTEGQNNLEKRKDEVLYLPHFAIYSHRINNPWNEG